MNLMNLGMVLANNANKGKCSIEIASVVPSFTVTVVNLLKIFIPIILVIYGMIDLSKAVMANDDKVMKEAQTKLIKRIVYAIVIFFVVAVVQLVFGKLAEAGGYVSAQDGKSDNEKDKTNVSACISCFISDTSKCNFSD